MVETVGVKGDYEMSLASVTAKLRKVALHLGRADTGGYYCGGKRGERLHTWQPEQATCKKCLAAYKRLREGTR